ncbi:hypothetical protein N2152v2_006261 [Parachlorella kessleri]
MDSPKGSPKASPLGDSSPDTYEPGPHDKVPSGWNCLQGALDIGGHDTKRDSSARTLPRSHITKVASAVLASPDGQPSFGQKLGQLLKATRTQLPTATIEYRGLSVEADALVGSYGNPSVANSFTATAKFLTFQGGLKTRPVQLLQGVSGVLQPGRMTLLLGPPGAGKSLLLKVLSGRLKKTKHLRVSGSVRYNGVESDEFVIRRTAGLVDQEHYHMPMLTVLETVDFAGRCQNPRSEVERYVSELDEAAGRLRRRKAQALGGGAGDESSAALEAAERGHAKHVKLGLDHSDDSSGSSSPTSGATNQPQINGPRGSSKQLQTQLSARNVAKEASGKLLALLRDEELAAELFDEQFYKDFREVASRRLMPHLVLGIMGLVNCADTFVGNNMVRGISGGERTRLTTAEILVGPQSVVLMDEISTGLDSATAYSVLRTFRDVAHSLDRTMLISLLQPAPECIQLFDDVLLLTEGQVIYHGPVDQVLPFFNTLGYACPERKDPGSFLQEVTTPLGQLSYATPELMKAKGVAEDLRTPEALLAAHPRGLLTPIEEIASAFWTKNEWGTSTMNQLEKRPFNRAAGSPQALFTTHYANSIAYLTKLVFKRLGLINLRMRGFYLARVVQTTVMGLIIGSLFNGIEPTAVDGRNVLAVCAQSVVFLSMSSMPQMGLVFSTKRVFYKHRDNNFFPAWSYVCGMVLVQLPQSTMESIVYSVTVYFLANLTRTASNFFIFLLITWTASNCLAGLVRLVAYCSSTMVMGNSSGGLLLLVMILTNGFSIVRTSIPPYMLWIYWINPFSWSIRAVAINELMSERWDIPLSPTAGSETLGEAVLEPFGFFTQQYWIWACVGFMWVSLLVYTIAGAVALTFTDPPHPRPTVPEEESKVQVTKRLLSSLSRRRRRRQRQMSVKLTSSKELQAPETAAPKATNPPPSLEPGLKVEGENLSLQQQPAGQEMSQHVVVPFTPITLVCRDIHYYVPDPSKGEAAGVVKGSGDRRIEGKLELLKGISLYAEPGNLIALMGGSGAGKTTLMDVICGRKTVGVVRGDIYVNGHPKQQETWSRVVGYVEQQDIHSAGTTVREALMFSARMRLEEDTISLEQVKWIVEEALEMVELTKLAGSVVGEAGGDWGLSTEQRKRLSIAVELVANPSVVFMDEPTSGLDARAAAIVMRAMENVARSNRTVMVTIHQPSMDIFEAFDTLVLLQLGGKLIYFGPLGYEGSKLIAYLEACPGVESIKPGYNPATWMLEVTGGSMATVFRHAGGDFPAIYQASELHQKNKARMDKLVEAGRGQHEPLKLASRYATSLGTQRFWLIKRFFAIYWRSPQYNYVRLVMSLLVSLFYGITYINEGKLDESGVGISTVQNIMGLIYSMAIFLGMFNAMTVQPVVAAERVVFYRETAASMYSPAPYAMATGVAELPYLAAQTLLLVCITYWLVGFAAVASKFFIYLILIFLSLTMYTFLGEFLVFVTPNLLLATVLCASFNQLWSLVNGFLIPYSLMPVGWKWLNRISPTTWILYGLGGSQLADSDVPLVAVGGVQTTVGTFMGSYFGYEPGFEWWCVLIVAAYVVAFRVGAMLLLRFISFQRR